MTKAEVKRLVCEMAAELLDVDAHQDSWLMERLDRLPDADRSRAYDAVRELCKELGRRSISRRMR